MARRLILTLCALFLWIGAIPASASADDAPADPMQEEIDKRIEKYFDGRKKDFRVYWKNGLNFATRDKSVTMKLGGRIQLDFWSYLGDGGRDVLEDGIGDEWHSGYEFRRARLFVEGEIHKHVGWKLQLDFAGGEVTFKDVWVELRNLDECWGCMVPDVKIGHFKEFFSLESLTSSKYISFMERSLPVQAFGPPRNTGVGLFRSFLGQHMTLGVGWWGNADEYGDGEWQDGSNITGRWTWLPWAPCGCEQRFWEIGFSGSYRFDQQNGVRYRVRPEGHVGPRIIDTGTLDADEEVRLGAETAINYDRWGAQGEIMGARPSLDGEEDPLLWGWYVQATYQLNGGTRRFRRSYATFDKMKPCRNFGCDGAGQWELALRYSALDLEDEQVYGGVLRNVTLGVNWYLNPNTRITFNYVYADGENVRTGGGRAAAPSGVDGDLHQFGVRFQIYW